MPGSIPGSPTTPPPVVFDILAVMQSGRLEAEALALAGSFARTNAGFPGRLILAEPQPGPLWPDDPRATPETRSALAALGADVLPFESRAFGAAYPHGNKIEALTLLGARPFLFLDTDTLILGPLAGLDVTRPSASMRRGPTWPKAQPGGPGREAVWRGLYARFGLDYASSLDPSYPRGDWRRWLYFNAGWFCGPDAAAFGGRFLDIATSIRDNPGEILRGQSLDPWLDQVALPLVIHGLGGGRPDARLDGLDGALTCHWRTLPLLHAREGAAAQGMMASLAADPDLGPLLRRHEPFRRSYDDGDAARIAALVADGVPPDEGALRRSLKAAGLWYR